MADNPFTLSLPLRPWSPSLIYRYKYIHIERPVDSEQKPRKKNVAYVCIIISFYPIFTMDHLLFNVSVHLALLLPSF